MTSTPSDFDRRHLTHVCLSMHGVITPSNFEKPEMQYEKCLSQTGCHIENTVSSVYCFHGNVGTIYMHTYAKSLTYCYHSFYVLGAKKF